MELSVSFWIHPLNNGNINIILYQEHEEYHVYKKSEVGSFKILDNKYKLPWSVFVGAAGMPGKTAYYAWNLFANAKRVGLDSSPSISMLI